ncbi:hypothetical protein [Alkalibacterium olivapovliticus]|uniref:Uncharacterized protein n=1 Tax=Alkalibacterium olivapovliticus TaxID=99907 RepID=A0A2T0VTV1_9LACT|nr:hypothetical protein [Alkalibacterium olivapovliticus]PRY74755.1 hypothetical protein CLV38_13911 [Alkalibacterium olivapovliticus]
MEYTIEEIINKVIEQFNISNVGIADRNRYRKRIEKIIKDFEFDAVDEDDVPVSRKRSGKKYSENVKGFILFNNDHENYKRPPTAFEYWLNQSEYNSYAPVKPADYYQSEVEKIEIERAELLPKIDLEKEMSYSQDYINTRTISEEDFSQKKVEIMSRALFDMFFILDEEKLQRDMEAYLYSLTEQTPEMRRAIDDLENHPHRYVSYKEELNQEFKTKLSEYLNIKPKHNDY